MPPGNDRRKTEHKCKAIKEQHAIKSHMKNPKKPYPVIEPYQSVKKKKNHE